MSHGGDEVAQVVGFLDEAIRSVALRRLPFSEVDDITAADDDWGKAVEGAQFLKGFEAGHFGHGHVHEDEADFVLMSAEDADGFLAIAGGEDAIAVRFEQGFGDHADHDFVIDQQDGFIAADIGGGGGGGGGGLERSDGLIAWEEDAEGSALTWGGLTFHPSAVLLDDAVGGGEAEAGAFALFFGGEERLEDFIDNFRRHTAAGIGDGQADVFPGHGLEAAGVLSGDDFVVSADGDGSFAGAGLHGVAGIDAQVHDNLFEFADIGVGGPEGGVEVQFDGELSAEAALDERVEFAQGGVEVAVGEFDVASAGESEQSFDELGGSFGGGAGVVDVVAGVFESRGGEVAIGERQVSEDTGEQIVKVVGDATGEAADGLHFLGLFQAFLELLFVG